MSACGMGDLHSDETSKGGNSGGAIAPPFVNRYSLSAFDKLYRQLNIQKLIEKITGA